MVSLRSRFIIPPGLSYIITILIEDEYSIVMLYTHCESPELIRNHLPPSLVSQSPGLDAFVMHSICNGCLFLHMVMLHFYVVLCHPALALKFRAGISSAYKEGEETATGAWLLFLFIALYIHFIKVTECLHLLGPGSCSTWVADKTIDGSCSQGALYSQSCYDVVTMESWLSTNTVNDKSVIKLIN